VLFIDESGLSQKPQVVRTWAPKGHTPILDCNTNYKRISIMVAMSLVNFCFALVPKAVQWMEVLQFLEQLLVEIPDKMLIVWDRLPSHRKPEVQAFLSEHAERIVAEELPAYAPELNPCEYLFSDFKQHRLPNFCPRTFAELRKSARRHLNGLRLNERLITGFWAASGLK
jgi:transposase